MDLRNRFAHTLGLLLVIATTVGHAQLRRIPADLTPIVESHDVRAGMSARVALRIRLPEGFHTNSNRPRDPLLIPITLWVQPPAGITATEVVYPEPTDLRQEGAEQPLAVFEREFTIGV